jgi:hypothetical protein
MVIRKQDGEAEAAAVAVVVNQPLTGGLDIDPGDTGLRRDRTVK